MKPPVPGSLVIGAALVGILVAALAAPAPAPAAAADAIPCPTEHFGHPMGADRKLVSYDEAVPYYELLAARSDRVQVERTGKTTAGRDMLLVIVSTPENLARAQRHREIAARLDDPRGLTPAGIDSLVAEGKTILLFTLNIHSDEIASSQMALEWVHRLAAGGPESAARWLEDVIVLVVPSVNPDGQVMVTEWYREHRNTPFEGGPLPRLYHPYAGHDNNRDWFMLNLAETRAVNRVAYHEWHPQVLVDEHQMGPSGPRLFVPPYADPVSPNVHPLIHRGSLLFGANMAMDLEQAGKQGVIYGYSFDAYWPGATRSTPWWKNTVGILTEAASARVATPIHLEPGELHGGRKGLPEYRAQINFPNPWPGGWWRLGDIVEYELILTDSALRTAALHREDLLRNRARMALDEVTRGRDLAPHAYVIPPDQHDPGTAARLAEILLENGLEAVRVDSELALGDAVVPAGSVAFRADQPYRPLLVELLEPQVFPEIRTEGGGDEIYRPYDVTAWSLPHLMGVAVEPLDEPLPAGLPELTAPVWTGPRVLEQPGTAWALSPAANDAYPAVLRLLAAGTAVYRHPLGFRHGATDWPPGTFLTEAPADRLEAALAGLSVQARRVSLPPTGAVAPDHGLAGRDDLRPVARPRVALYQSWAAPLDEGWTRFVLDGFEMPYTVLHNEDVRAGALGDRFDALILPEQSRSRIVEGPSPLDRGGRAHPRPSPYDEGLGPEGVAAIREFVRTGGMLLTFGAACEFAMEELDLPVENAVAGKPRSELSTPGTVLAVTVDPRDPVGYGMPEAAFVYHTNDPAFSPRPGEPTPGRTVVRFAPAERLVASGWAKGTDALAGRGALVRAPLGRGEAVLFGFRPQFRGQTHGTYRLIFNALFEAAAE